MVNVALLTEPSASPLVTPFITGVDNWSPTVRLEVTTLSCSTGTMKDLGALSPLFQVRRTLVTGKWLTPGTAGVLVGLATVLVVEQRTVMVPWLPPVRVTVMTAFPAVSLVTKEVVLKLRQIGRAHV